MSDDETEPHLFFTVRCRGCGATLRLRAKSKDDLLAALAASRWEMQPRAPMADPVDDCEPFLCVKCAP